MNYLWLAAIPVWIFFWIGILQGFFLLSERYEWFDKWWHLPLWVAFGMPSFVVMIIGIFYILDLV